MREANLAGVLCSGSIVYDILVRPVDEASWGTTSFVETMDAHVGGNGANTSIALARIGIPVRLAGTVGSDDRAGFLLDSLSRTGVETGAIGRAAGATASTVVIVNSAGDRKFLHRLGASAEAFPEPLDFAAGLAASMSHYHLASLFVLPRMRAHAGETLRRARAAGLTTSLDTNWDPLGQWMEVLAPCFPHLDILFLNEDEARMVTGHSEPRPAAEVVLGMGVGTAVMKLGARGCAIYSGGEETLCPAFEVEARDTTGAGDCFVAGFLAARLRGAGAADAGHFANAVAAMSVRRVGAVTGIPAYPEIIEWIGSARLRQPEGVAR